MILHLKSSGITSMSYVHSADYKHCARFYTAGSKMGDGVASAVFGKNRVKLFAYQATQASSEQNSTQSAWHLTLSVAAEIRTSSSSLTLYLACRLWADLNWKYIWYRKSWRIIVLLQILEKVLFCAGFQAMSTFLAMRELMLQLSRLFRCPSQAWNFLVVTSFLVSLTTVWENGKRSGAIV